MSEKHDAIHALTYSVHSKLDRSDVQGVNDALYLASDISTTTSSVLFDGVLHHPRRVAEMLLALMDVVKARHHIPAAMLNRILAEADPVVTTHSEQLRFEGFSACCSAYARVDIDAAGFTSNSVCSGTTNVDFNEPMLRALSRMRDTNKLGLRVAQDAVELHSDAAHVIEKRVPLPTRWLRGFVEVQSIQSRMQLVHRAPSVIASRLLGALPRDAKGSQRFELRKRGKQLVIGPPTGNGMAVAGLARLWMLARLVVAGSELDIYEDPLTGSTAWVVRLENARFTLMLSADVWRGFSGEGQALMASTAADHRRLAIVRTQLAWHGTVNVDKLIESTGLDADSMMRTLMKLSVMGKLGYDLALETFFHRDLPYDLSNIERQQPRLAKAMALVDSGAVCCQSQSEHRFTFDIASGKVSYRCVVDLVDEDAWHCSCPWYAKHANTRGPCAHALAALISERRLKERGI